MYSTTLSLTWALDGGVVNATLLPLYPREGTLTNCAGGSVGPRTDLDECEKFRSTEILSPARPARRESL